ncbi:hypothetical protein PV08_11662 [Exophiala spinifera]|uniref:Uncharacterized protein n=1 Tax=Exophiala spinifera TaxID=91928 RepID=A0A0D2AVE2_9EURO|nr:uncharacterized protein PV08_11662 [Exophiala spinifera]KIW10698.1 hypothetical protein PV08_11662 [Exophiala spinifera]
MHDLPRLFPFPASFSPRLELTLANGSSWMNLGGAKPPLTPEDFGRIFDEFLDISLLPFETGL